MGKNITIGIAGHVDHGKTSLVKALTGTDTDRLKEEKRRGLSIESGIALIDLDPDVVAALVDVPGHTDFLKNTIRGLSNVDAALLLVAADDGVMPQTREHIEILRFFGVEKGFVVLSKVDLVDEETLELAELEIRELLESSFFQDSPIILFSAISQKGLDDVKSEIKKLVELSSGKDTQAPFRLWIDQVKGFPGFGTVVSGTILSGRIRQGDVLHLLPTNLETRIRSLETHHQNVEEALAGQRVGLNLHRIPLKDVRRGMLLASPGDMKSTDLLNVDLEVLSAAEGPIRNRQRVRLYLGTAAINTLVILMDRERLEPGEKGLAQFRLMKPIAALPGDPFVVCPLNTQITVAGGKVLEVPHQKFRQGKAAMMISSLKALQQRDLRGYVKHALKSSPFHLLRVSELARNTGFPLKELEAIIREMAMGGKILSFKGSGFFGKEQYRQLKGQTPEILVKIFSENSLKQLATPEEIKNKLAPTLDDLPFQRMLGELCHEGKLIKENGGFKVPNHPAKLSDEREMMITLLLEYARASGFVPFSADTFWKLHHKRYNKNEVQRLLDYLQTQGRLVRLNNRRFMIPQTIEAIKNRVKAVIERNGALTIGDCKEVLGYGRTVGIPVFEYLDSIGFTQRDGDKRFLKAD